MGGWWRLFCLLVMANFPKRMLNGLFSKMGSELKKKIFFYKNDEMIINLFFIFTILYNSKYKKCRNLWVCLLYNFVAVWV